jgi:parvulin-like peptidyl-prolyl isomerase
MKVLLRLLPLALIGLVAASCSSLAVAAATVNGHRITQEEVEQQLKLLTNDPAFGEALRSDPNVARGDGRRQVLTTLIYATVAEDEAAKYKIDPSKAQVDQLISERAQSEGATSSQFLRSQHLSLAEGRQIARRLLIQSELQSRVLHNTVVSDASIKQVYEQNKASFAEAHLLRITVPNSSDVRDILTKVNSGTDFATLAKQKSIDQLGPNGGDMGFVLMSGLSPQEQDAVSRAKTGGVTDPIPTQSAFEIFKVAERRTQPLDEAAQEIGSTLQQQQRQQDYQSWLQARVRASHIVVNPQYGHFDKAQGQVVRASTNLAP